MTDTTRLNPEDEQVLLAAIRRAEKGSRGEVQVHLERTWDGDPVVRAEEMFSQLGLDRTAEGTGVLLYVAVESRKAAVWAGDGLHGATEPRFWNHVVARVVDGYRSGAAVQGLCSAIDLVGDLLRKHFPAQDVAGNEVPDKVSTS